MQEPPRRILPIEPLEAAAFAACGEVIEASERARPFEINEGWARRYDELARIDTTREGGHTRLSLFRARARPLPLRLALLERHRLGSQAFFPATPRRFLVVVAAPADRPEPAQVRAFLAAPGQGVNYAAGTWHHPLIALDEDTDFLVIDRGSALEDNEIWRPDPAELWVQA